MQAELMNIDMNASQQGSFFDSYDLGESMLKKSINDSFFDDVDNEQLDCHSMDCDDRQRLIVTYQMDPVDVRHGEETQSAVAPGPDSKIDDLHALCCASKVSIDKIRAALARDPASTARWASVATDRKVYDPVTGKVTLKNVNESYKYPLNLAIRHKASIEVIRALVLAAPEVTLFLDGPEQETALLVMLKYSPNCTQGINALLLPKTQRSSPVDRRRNTVLHSACRYGAPLEVIRHLVTRFPDALHQRNVLNELPVHLVQRNSVVCSTDVASFVWQQTNKGIHNRHAGPNSII